MSNRNLIKSYYMIGEIKDIGQVMFGKDGTKETFIEIVSRLDLKPPVVIKQNWSTSKVFTEAEILDWTLSALDCEKIVVESCAHYRSPIFLNLDRPIDAEFEKQISGQKKKHLRENEEWFLELSSIADILRKHEVEYLNLSEELWSKRVCEPDQIRSLVESCFEPLVNDNLYSMVPTKLHDMRGGTLLSISKPKLAQGTIGVSMSIKNLFGMISTPYRGKFHGPNDAKLNDSIIDITKICQSLFDIRGVVEAVFSTSSFDESQMMGQIFRDLGFIWGSNNIFELDVIVTTQLGLGIQEVGHLSQASKIFGESSQQTIEIAMQNPIKLQ